MAIDCRCPPQPREPSSLREEYADYEFVYSQYEVDDYIFKLESKQHAKGRIVADMPRQPTLKDRFLVEAAKWENETGHLSSPNQKMLHPSYQAILGMGKEHREEIIDLLIHDLKDNRRPWFWALSYIAQANPIKPDDAGRMDRMIDAWVRWGKTREHA